MVHVVMMVVVVVMVMMVVMMHRMLHRRGGSRVLRDGVSGQADGERGGDDKTLEHGL